MAYDKRTRPPNPRQLGLHIRGTFFLCPDLPGKPCGLYVFQGVLPGRGNIPGYAKKDRQIRRWVRPADPKTPAQLFRRNLFRTAVIMWWEMSPAERASWYTKGRSDHKSGLNAWLSYALKGGISV